MREEFEKLYGRAPQWIARAPGRVNLIGEHTDYNGGFVAVFGICKTPVMVRPSLGYSMR